MLNFVLHKDKPMDKYRTDVGITDLDSGEIYNPKVRDIFIELPKFNKFPTECVDDSELWLYLIKNMEDMDVNAVYFPFAKDSKFTKFLKKGFEKGKQVGIKMGVDQGLKMGVNQGIYEEKRRVAKQMKQQGLSIQTIAICSGLTEEEIRLL